MENESTEGRTLSVDLPAALDGWLAERADELDVGESELLVQLVGSYRAAADAEDGAKDPPADTIAADVADIEAIVRETVDEAVAAAAPDEDAIARRVEDRLASRIDGVETEFEGQLDDVRRRVVQVKQEADSKAAGDHDHDEFRRLDEVASAVEELREQVDEPAAEAGPADAEPEWSAQVEELRTKLTQLARIVVELRDEVGQRSDDETLREIKRTAAREGHEEAVCGACNETVHVGLLPEAECPHCRSPFGGLAEGSGGLFASKPRLVGPHGRRDTGHDDEDAGAVSDISPEEGPDGEADGGTPVTTDGGADE
jgi:hypothetical protein